jgi:hypothetical protein
MSRIYQGKKKLGMNLTLKKIDWDSIPVPALSDSCNMINLKECSGLNIQTLCIIYDFSIGSWIICPNLQIKYNLNNLVVKGLLQ